MNFSLKPSSGFVRSMLSGHSAIGLAVAALLYIVCVTGTFSVFYPDFERWEQPQVAEFSQVSREVITSVAQRLLDHERARTGKTPDQINLTLPSSEMPRFEARAGETSVFVNADGRFIDKIDHGWTHFLTMLHFQLSMPNILGLTLVGIIGVMLVAMIASGLLAHPNIFKDAFSLRMSGSKRLQQVDLHNRLSVWASPFLLIIAATGALIGLSSILLFVFATLFYEGDTEAVSRSLFLSGPDPTGVAAPLADIGTALEQLNTQRPDLHPTTLVIHEPATTAQQLEVGALVPNRLVWSEFFAFDSEGKLLKSAGWSSGDAGVQIYASTFRLHFGHFGGLPVKIAYLLLGIVMCVICATGINTWLLRQRQRHRPRPELELAWVSIVWGTPLAIALSALAYISVKLSPVAVFWGALPAVLTLTVVLRDTQRLSRLLRSATAVIIGLLLGVYIVRFGYASFGSAALAINFLWLLLAVTLVVSLS